MLLLNKTLIFQYNIKCRCESPVDDNILKSTFVTNFTGGLKKYLEFITESTTCITIQYFTYRVYLCISSASQLG